MTNPPEHPKRPITTAEKVVEAIRSGATTLDVIAAVTGLSPSVVGIQLTRLARNGVVFRRRALGKVGQSGARPWVYRLATPEDRARLTAQATAEADRQARQRDAARVASEAADAERRRAEVEAAMALRLATPQVTDLGLPPAVAASLWRADVLTVAELAQSPDEFLLALPEIGPAAVRKIHQAIDRWTSRAATASDPKRVVGPEAERPQVGSPTGENDPTGVADAAAGDGP